MTPEMWFVLLVIVALGPANWAPRSGLGWKIDHFVGYLLNLPRDRETKRLRGLKIDYEFKLGCLLHRKTCGLCAFKYPINVSGGSTKQPLCSTPLIVEREALQ